MLDIEFICLWFESSFCMNNSLVLMDRKTYLDIQSDVVFGGEDLVVGVIEQGDDFSGFLRDRIRSLNVIRPAVADRAPVKRFNKDKDDVEDNC